MVRDRDAQWAVRHPDVRALLTLNLKPSAAQGSNDFVGAQISRKFHCGTLFRAPFQKSRLARVSGLIIMAPFDCRLDRHLEMLGKT